VGVCTEAGVIYISKLKTAVCGDTAYAPYGVLHLGFSWSYRLRPSLGFVNQKIRLKLLSAVFYWFFSLVFNFRYVFCGRGLGGVVDVGGVPVGRC
jgi:hypothetical protein